MSPDIECRQRRGQSGTAVVRPQYEMWAPEVTSELSLTDAEIGRITAGTLIVGDGSSGPITINAGLTLTGKNLTLVAGAGVTGSAAIVNGSATPVAVTIDQAGNSTYGGVLGGPAAGTANDKNLAVTKLGAGTLTLSGSNTYSGAIQPLARAR